MRVLLVIAIVIAGACGGGPAATTLPLYAGAAQLAVPDGPALALEARGDGAVLVGSHDGERFDVQALPGGDGARYGLLLVGANVVLLRASSFEGDQAQRLEAWCFLWDGEAEAFVTMATFEGDRGDELPTWIPASLHQQFAGD